MARVTWRATLETVSTPYIVKILAERPEAELRATQAQARAAIVELQVEVDQIDQALRIQAQQARRSSRPARKANHGGDTRESVLNALRDAEPGTTSPAAIVAAVKAEGSSVTAGAIRNMIRRLVDEGEAERVSEGVYKLASRMRVQSDAFAEPTENGEGPPSSLADPNHSRA